MITGRCFHPPVPPPGGAGFYLPWSRKNSSTSDRRGWHRDRTDGRICAHGWVAGASWRRVLARLAGDGPLAPATALAHAAYLARFAAETGHPTAAGRRAEIERWESEAHDIDLAAIHPLHQAVMSALRGKAGAGWESLQHNWLYRPRAGFEMEMLRASHAKSRKLPAHQARVAAFVGNSDKTQ